MVIDEWTLIIGLVLFLILVALASPKTGPSGEFDDPDSEYIIVRRRRED